MALDHPERVARAAVMDICPTLDMYERTDRAFATDYFHWFFLIQPHDLPERLIVADPDFYLERKIGGLGPGADKRSSDAFSPAALDEYKRCFRDPAAIHASCEDYRAAATIDLVHDRADLDRRIRCPLLVLWGAHGLVGRLYDVLGLWRERASDVTGRSIDCGHYLAEEAPADTLAALQAFL
jgi:haloacetate dehalogenase